MNDLLTRLESACQYTTEGDAVSARAIQDGIAEIDRLTDLAKRMRHSLKGLSVDAGFDFDALFPEARELLGE